MAGLLANAQYLPAMGPAPLRWKEISPPNPALLSTLPPLAVKTPETRADSEAQPAGAVTAPVLAEPGTNVPVTVTPSTTPGISTNQALVEAPPPNPEVKAAPVFPMEGLTPFFSPASGTNRTVGVILPLNFIPPTTPPPPSSSAAYSLPQP